MRPDGVYWFLSVTVLCVLLAFGLGWRAAQ